MAWDIKSKLEALPEKSLAHPDRLSELLLYAHRKGSWVHMDWQEVKDLEIDRLSSVTFCLRWKERSIFYYSNHAACVAISDGRDKRPLDDLVLRIFSTLVRAGLDRNKRSSMTFGRMIDIYQIAKALRARIVYCGEKRDRECSTQGQTSTQSSSQSLS